MKLIYKNGQYIVENYLLYIFMNNLPYELLEKIRRMAYQTQPNNMLTQIKIRHQLKTQLYEIYLELLWNVYKNHM